VLARDPWSYLDGVGPLDRRNFFSVYSLLPTTCTICVEQHIGYDIYELNFFYQLYASRII